MSVFGGKPVFKPRLGREPTHHKFRAVCHGGGHRRTRPHSTVQRCYLLFANRRLDPDSAGQRHALAGVAEGHHLRRPACALVAARSTHSNAPGQVRATRGNEFFNAITQSPAPRVRRVAYYRPTRARVCRNWKSRRVGRTRRNSHAQRSRSRPLAPAIDLQAAQPAPPQAGRILDGHVVEPLKPLGKAFCRAWLLALLQCVVSPARE